MLRQSNPIQSNTIRLAEESREAANLVGLSNQLVFFFGERVFNGFFFFVYFGFCDDLLKLLLAIMVDKWAYGLYKKSHPLITVIYLARRRKLFLFDWSSPEIIKQNPRNAK